LSDDRCRKTNNIGGIKAMEILIEKSKLADMNLIKGLRWEVNAIQKELRPLQAGIGGYDMEINRLTNEIQLLENKDFSVALDFKVHTTVTDDPESLEIERKRFQATQETAQQEISDLKAENLREIERVISALDTYRTERFARHEKEKERIFELKELLRVVQARMNEFLIIDVRPLLSGKEINSL